MKSAARPAPKPPPPEPDSDEAVTVIELAAGILDLGSQQRLWIRALLPVLSWDGEAASPAVQYALNVMRVLACRRLGRIFQSDLPADRAAAELAAAEAALAAEG